MADPIKLPKGYTLDSTPQTPTGPDASAEDVIRRLPKGYILDPTPQTPRGLDASVEDVIRRLPKGYTLETPQASSGGKSVGGFLDNLVDSAGSYVSDLTHAVTHPKETISAIGSIPVGLAEKAGVPMPAPGPGEQDAAQKLDAMIEHFKGRYGSLDNVKEALYKDPVGVLGDLSMVAGGAGAAADAANLTKVAKIANAAASVTDPLTIPGKAVSLVGKGVAKVADPAATMLTKSAL
jgi:hypothetical protein